MYAAITGKKDFEAAGVSLLHDRRLGAKTNLVPKPQAVKSHAQGLHEDHQ